MLKSLKTMEDTFKSNLRTLKELILDEGKLVTYVSLSKELCIHVNEAKDLLNRVVRDVKKMEPKPDIYICYMISGLLNNNNACIKVCPEPDLDGLRKTLNPIFFEHIYCVSKGMQHVDNLALTAANKFEDFTLCTGLIKSNSCSKRPDSETLNLNSNSTYNVVNDFKPTVRTKNTTEKKKDFFKTGVTIEKKGEEVKTEPVIKSKTPSPKKGTNNNKSSSKSSSKDIAGFFKKLSGDTNKTKNTKPKDDTKQEDKIAIKVEKEIKLEELESDKIFLKTNSEEPVQNSNKNVENDKNVNKSLKQIKNNAKVDKKRKRLLRVSDSESDNEDHDPFADNDHTKMAVDQDSEDEIPPTPTINTIKITSGIINPKKKRKIVDKTYTGEDGYIVTKKEVVYVSGSDDEDEIKTNIKQEKENVEVIQTKLDISPKQDGKVKKKKVSPPQKGKQQMLTNFFKKV